MHFFTHPLCKSEVRSMPTSTHVPVCVPRGRNAPRRLVAARPARPCSRKKPATNITVVCDCGDSEGGPRRRRAKVLGDGSGSKKTEDGSGSKKTEDGSGSKKTTHEEHLSIHGEHLSRAREVVARVAAEVHARRKALLPTLKGLDDDPRNPFAAVHTYLDRNFRAVLQAARTGNVGDIKKALTDVQHPPLKRFMAANRDIALLCHEMVLQLVSKALA